VEASGPRRAGPGRWAFTRASRQALGVVATACIFVIAGAPGAAEASDDWPQPWFDGGKTAYNPGPDVPNVNQGSTLREVRTIPLRPDGLVGTPVVVSNAMYTFVREEVMFEEIFVKVGFDGSIRWESPGECFERPVVADRVVAARWGCTQGDPPALLGMNRRTGARRWSEWYFPYVSDGTTLYGIRGTNVFESPWTLFAVGAWSGAPHWSWGPFERREFGPPVVAGRRVYSSLGGTVIAFEASTGLRKWRYSDPGGRYANVVAAASGVVYLVVSDGRQRWLVALDVQDQSVLWERHLFRTLSLRPGGAIVVSPRAIIVPNNQRLLALSPATGEKLWGRQVNAFDLLTAAGRFLFVPTFGAGVQVRRLADGKLLSSIEGPGPAVAVRDRLLTGGTDGAIHMYG
jgi:outer membrane protein assembly factor BamB